MAYFGQATPETGTDAEMLALWKACLASISVVGQSYKIRERMFTHADLAEVRATVDWLEAKVAAVDGRGAAVNYAKRMPPV
jgi:hypothetical protein